MRNIFEETKSKLNIVDVAEFYGLQLDKHNKCVCPFHDEKTPSFSISRKKQMFHCFGCNASGDVINLTQMLLHLTSPFEAVKRLNGEFSLGLNLEPHKPTMQEKTDTIRLKRRKTLINSWDEWKDKALKTMFFYEKFYKKMQVCFEPKSMDEEPHPLFVKSCQKSEYLSFLIDEVLTADEAERERTWQEFYKNDGDGFLYELKNY